MNYVNYDKTSQDRKAIKIAEYFEGFGATIAWGAHIFTVTIPADVKGSVTITEDYGIKGGEGSLPLTQDRVLLPRILWSGIAEASRKDFAVRLKEQKLRSSRWNVGVNKVDRMLGKELCVLAWAVEHAESADEAMAIADQWAVLKPQERWWFFSHIAAVAGFPHEKNEGWRKAIYLALGPKNSKRKNTCDSFDGTLALSA